MCLSLSLFLSVAITPSARLRPAPGGAEEDRCLGAEAAHAATAVPSASLLSVPTGSDLPPPAGVGWQKHGKKNRNLIGT